MAEQKTAKSDITIVDGVGRRVVVVPKGQPIPDDLDAAKKRAGEVQRTASDEEIASARGVQDKARRSSRGK